MIVDYTGISKTYDEFRSYPKSLIEALIEFAGIKEGMRILDLGCGTGNVASQLLELINVKIIGVDLSLPMLEVAKEKSLDVICANADNSQLPFCDSSFDTIVGAYVFHQIDNLRFLFSECHRILRAGALVFLTSSHHQIDHQHPIIKQFFPGCIDIDKNRFPDIPEVYSLLHSAGFQDIKNRELLVENIPMDQDYLRKVQGKYVSTYRLLPQKEFDLGVKRLEAFIKAGSQPELREWRSTLVSGRKVID